MGITVFSAPVRLSVTFDDPVVSFDRLGPSIPIGSTRCLTSVSFYWNHGKHIKASRMVLKTDLKTEEASCLNGVGFDGTFVS